LKEWSEGQFVSQKEKTSDGEGDNNNESYQLHMDHNSVESATGDRMGQNGWMMVNSQEF
jgi:hypothetical protein